MPATRALCHALAVATGVLTYLGTLLIDAVAGGDLARTVGREAIDLAPFWYFALPVCYLDAGALGYLVPLRTWRWSHRDARDPRGLHAALGGQRP